MLRHFRHGHRVTTLVALTATLSLGAGAYAATDAPAKAPVAAAAKPGNTKPGKKAARKKKKDAPAPLMPAAIKEPAPHRRIGASPAYVVGDSSAHFINQAAPPIEQFPSDSKAVRKAFDETRRDQLADAEKAARDGKTPDRWRSVLFALRGLPERTDPEACFWRVLAFYRLGELTRARALRESCDLTAKESGALNNEDATAAGVPEMGTVPFDDGFGPPPGAAGTSGTAGKVPVAPPPTAPYTGIGPDHR
jgi:hypothetical protein